MSAAPNKKEEINSLMCRLILKPAAALAVSDAAAAAVQAAASSTKKEKNPFICAPAGSNAFIITAAQNPPM